MEKYKNLTILHSNDMHSDFLSESFEEKELGGISMLSGYVSKVKAENPNTIYCIAGDMLQGSLIDTEFRGISTIEIMNRLNPDVVSLGNHEIDYGLGHLLLLERCAKFPIVNANLFIKNPYTRLFQAHEILYVDGMKIMFIGIITSEILSPLKQDLVLSTLVDVEDAAKEVGKICNTYRTTDIDFTVLLTHIGFEEDKKLAALLDPNWGVDVIIGGHSHTILEKPEVVNDILVVQAGVGTNQIGRFDIVVDTDENNVSSYTWELIPIDSAHCPTDKEIEKAVSRYKNQIDAKYEQILCKFLRPLTHPDRNQETELGNLMTDALKTCLKVDIMMLGSGSIRKESAGPDFTRRELLEMMPYDDKLYQLKVTGEQFKKMYAFMLRDEAFAGESTEFYQYSTGVEVEYDYNKKQFTKFNFEGKPIKESEIYTVGLQDFHYSNFKEFFGFPLEEVAVNGKPVVIATSILDVIEEYLSTHATVDAKVEGRLVVIK
jgi:5''-nucleotidase/2'',3''-cyclic phosphodiesterase and related esterases